MKCLFCGGELKFIGKHIRCQSCYSGVDLETHKGYISELTPTYIKDSMKVLKIIAEGSPLFIFGREQLFSPEFKESDCSLVSNAADITAELPSELLSYRGIPAVLLRKMLYNYHEVGADIYSVIEAMSGEEMFGALLLTPDRLVSEISYDEVRVLTALMAPTWVDCSEALLSHIETDIFSWSDSELLYSTMLCNKFSIIEGLEFKDAEQALINFIYERSKFVHRQNSEISGDEESRDFLMQVDRELMVVNTHIDGTFVHWLFATHCPYPSLPRPGTKGYDEIKAASRGMLVLWYRYGEHNSLARRVFSDAYHENNVTTYIDYWESIREKFRRWQ